TLVSARISSMTPATERSLPSSERGSRNGSCVTPTPGATAYASPSRERAKEPRWTREPPPRIGPRSTRSTTDRTAKQGRQPKPKRGRHGDENRCHQLRARAYPRLFEFHPPFRRRRRR